VQAVDQDALVASAGHDRRRRHAQGIHEQLDGMAEGDIEKPGRAAFPHVVRVIVAALPGGPQIGGIDAVLLDIAMPNRDGLDTLKQFRSELPRLPVLMLSTYPDKQYAVRCLKLGASGYINKSADTDQLLEAIRKAANGGVYVTNSQAEALAVSLSVRTDLQPHEFLSDREYQVLRLIATGQSVAQIAAQLSLSPNTVSTYRARICEKTGTRNDVEIALYAVRQGLHEV